MQKAIRDGRLGGVAGLGFALALGCGSPAATSGGAGSPAAGGDGGTLANGGGGGSGGSAPDACGGTECGGAAGQDATDTPGGGQGPTCAADVEADALNCGRCDRACPTGALCTHGHCLQSLAPGAGYGLTKDEQYVYAVVNGSESHSLDLLRIQQAGDAPEVLASEANAARVYGLALDAKNAYFARAPSAGTEVYSVPKAGGTYQLFAKDTAGVSNGSVDVATDETHVYWIGHTSIYRALLAGGAPEHWATTCVAKQLVLTNGALYWACGAVTGTSGAIGRKATSRAALDGASESVAGADDYSLGPFAVDADRVYWASNFGGGGFKSVGATGGLVTSLPASGIRWINAIAFDAQDLYLAGCPNTTCEPKEHRLVRGTKSGDGWTVLADLPDTPEAVVVAGSYAYVSLASPTGLIRISID